MDLFMDIDPKPLNVRKEKFNVASKGTEEETMVIDGLRNLVFATLSVLVLIATYYSIHWTISSLIFASSTTLIATYHLWNSPKSITCCRSTHPCKSNATFQESIAAPPKASLTTASCKSTHHAQETTEEQMTLSPLSGFECSDGDGRIRLNDANAPWNTPITTMTGWNQATLFSLGLFSSSIFKKGSSEWIKANTFIILCWCLMTQFVTASSTTRNFTESEYSLSQTAQGHSAGIFQSSMTVIGFGSSQIFSSSVQPYDGSWVNIPTDTNPLNATAVRMFGQSKVQVENVIYMINPETSGGSATNGHGMFLYNLETNEYTASKNIPLFAGSKGCAEYDHLRHLIYYLGGINPWSDKAQRYNISNSSWSYMASLPSRRRENGCAMNSNGDNLYEFGGVLSDGATRLDTINRYNISNDTWIEIDATLSIARDSLFCSLFVDTLVYCSGGYTAIVGSERTNIVDIFDPATETIIDVTYMNYFKTQHMVNVYENCMIISGGYGGIAPNSGYWLDSIEYFGNCAFFSPTSEPTSMPTNDPTKMPSFNPSANPSVNPTEVTSNPTSIPTLNPSSYPTSIPTINPSIFPSFNPSTNPTIDPTIIPSTQPTSNPSQTQQTVGSEDVCNDGRPRFSHVEEIGNQNVPYCFDELDDDGYPKYVAELEKGEAIMYYSDNIEVVNDTAGYVIYYEEEVVAYCEDETDPTKCSKNWMILNVNYVFVKDESMNTFYCDCYGVADGTTTLSVALSVIVCAIGILF